MHTTTVLLTLLPLAAAKYGLDGCTSTTLNNIVTYYVPSSGEICDILDCGGGRAPPKTTVPGCGAYSGTASYHPSYLTIATPSVTTVTPTASPTVIIDKSSDLLPGTTNYSNLPGTTIIIDKTSNLPGTTVISSAPTGVTTFDNGNPGFTVIPTGTGKPGSNFTASTNSPSASGTSSVSPGAAAGTYVPSRSLLGLVGAVLAGIAML